MTRKPPGRDPRRTATTVYITVVAVLAVCLGVVCLTRYGLPDLPALGVFVLLALLHVVLPDAVVEGRVRVSLSSVVLLASQAIVGPAGVAMVGAVLGMSQGRRLLRRNRVFNAAQFSLHGAVGGIAFLLVGGTIDPDRLQDVSGLVLGLALPMLVADLAQAVVNLLALAGVVRVAEGVPMRHQVLSVLRGTGLAYIGYGVIALILVVLWEPAGLGPAATVIVLAPLFVAQWAYRQHAEELRGQQRALEVLVAAVEAKAPHLAGHSARVAELSEHMAEHLGLAPRQVADTRVAGMLHDVGQTSLPTSLVRHLDLTAPDSGEDYAERGAQILGDLGFLHGALDPIRRHRTALAGGPASPLPARIVALADTYDLLTRVGTPEGPLYAPAHARDILAARAAADPALVRALDHALARRSEAVPQS